MSNTKGLSSVKTLTANEIAKKWDLPLKTVAKKIAAGIKVEKEHTKSTKQANEIARDHLGERPDYYEKLDKMEKTKIVKEDLTGVDGVRGLGYVTGDPGVNPVQNYINTNAMAYEDENGNALKYIQKMHDDLHNKGLGFQFFNPTNIKTSSNKDLAESRLDELGGDYDRSSRGVDVVGDLTGSTKTISKLDVKEEKPCWKGYEMVGMKKKGKRKVPNCVPVKEQGSPANPSYTERPTYEGKNVVPAQSVERGIYEVNKKEVKEYLEPYFITAHKEGEKSIRKRLGGRMSQTIRANKPDAGLHPGAKGTKDKTTYESVRISHLKEETKMDTKELINEALDNILEENLIDMKENLMTALQEKAMEKLEERKKIIASDYFAQ